MSFSLFINTLPNYQGVAFLTNSLEFSVEPVVANSQEVATQIFSALTPWPYLNVAQGLQARNCIKQIQRRQFPNARTLLRKS